MCLSNVSGMHRAGVHTTTVTLRLRSAGCMGTTSKRRTKWVGQSSSYFPGGVRNQVVEQRQPSNGAMPASISNKH